jgi:hypothetical protein
MVTAIGILASVVINVACLAWMMTVMVWVVIRTDPVPADSSFHTLIWTAIAVLVTGFLNYSAAVGAVAMLQLSDYRAAIRGAWFAMVPCGVGCVVAFPFAIWADCLLRDPRVTAVFSGEKLRFLWRGRS